MSENAPEPPGELRSSPISGCLILMTIIIVFGGLVVLYTGVGMYQTKKIDEFTQDEPAEIPVAEPDSEKLGTAKGKLKQIREAVDDERSERILLSADDLNILIAEVETLKDFRGQTWIESIRSEGLVVRASQAMRKGIFDKGRRYLNGVFVFRPELRSKTVAFKAVDIRPAEGTIPREFIENYAVLDFFRIDPETPGLAEVIPSVEAVYTEEDSLVVETGIAKSDSEE